MMYSKNKPSKIIRAIGCLLFLMSYNNGYAQFFNNVNQELCYELYRMNDPLSEYRVFIVIDEACFNKRDSLILKDWSGLSLFERQTITQRWAADGRRIESERQPYISYPPTLHNKKPFMVPVRVSQKIDWENSAWSRNKKFWAFPDRPF